MQQEGCKPNDLVLSSVLTSYANAGLVDEGRSFFHTMKERYGILPRYEHYVCMVDLLGRAGHLMEAEDLLRKTKHTLDGWMSLLSSCKMHGKVDIARHSFEQIVHVDPHMTAAYELMSDIYEKACMWKEAEAIRAVRKHNNTWKKPGKAWIELNRKVYEFVVGDRGMLQDDQVVAKRKILRRKMDEEGYQPQLSWREIEKEISSSKS
jgi:pentatricopeptide repeat protein